MTDIDLDSRSTGTIDGEGRWTRLSRTTGLLGLASFVLVFVPIVAISTVGEPPFTATAAEAQAFFRSASQGWVQIAQAVTVLAGIGLIWFVVGLALLLGRAEGSPPWRAAVAGVSGLLLPVYLLVDASWDAAAYGGARDRAGSGELRVRRGQPRLRQRLDGDGQLRPAAGWLVLETRVLGRWLGWWAVVAGLGLVLSRFVWTTGAWYLPYFAFWIWVVGGLRPARPRTAPLVRRPAVTGPSDRLPGGRRGRTRPHLGLRRRLRRARRPGLGLPLAARLAALVRRPLPDVRRALVRPAAGRPVHRPAARLPRPAGRRGRAAGRVRQGSRRGAVVSVVLLPVEAVFWVGFALPIPWFLGAARVALLAAAWPRLRGPRPTSSNSKEISHA